MTRSNIMVFLFLISSSKNIFPQEVTLHFIKFSPSKSGGVCFLHGLVLYVSKLNGIKITWGILVKCRYDSAGMGVTVILHF